MFKQIKNLASKLAHRWHFTSKPAQSIKNSRWRATDHLFCTIYNNISMSGMKLSKVWMWFELQRALAFIRSGATVTLLLRISIMYLLLSRVFWPLFIVAVDFNSFWLFSCPHTRLLLIFKLFCSTNFSLWSKLHCKIVDACANRMLLFWISAGF